VVMRVAWLGPYEEVRTSNVAYAAAPEAIVPSGPVPRKLPISDNDPTRNVPLAAQIVELFLVFVAVVMLVVLSILSVVAVLELS